VLGQIRGALDRSAQEWCVRQRGSVHGDAAGLLLLECAAFLVARGQGLACDRPKPALEAFRFPFVTRRTGRRSVRAWGLAPARGKVRIQRLVNGRWITAGTLTAGRNRLFVTSLKLRGQTTLRALNGGLSSLTWHQR